MPLGAANPKLYKEAVDAGKKQALVENPGSLDSDESKYGLATVLAKDELAGQRNVSRHIYKKTIDKYFKDLGGSISGKEMRGETKGTQLVDDLGDAINSINNGFGSAMDETWDRTIGDLVSNVAGPEAGENVKNLASGEDLALIPDFLFDTALAASGYGIPVVVAKELIRNADNFHNAFTGRDAITLEKLDDNQRLANGLLGFGGVALSAVPGIGKLRSIAKTSSKSTADKALTAAKKQFEETSADKKEAIKNISEQLGKTGENIPEDELLKAAAEAREGLVSQGKEAKDLLKKYGNKDSLAKKLDKADDAAKRDLSQKIQEDDASILNEIIRNEGLDSWGARRTAAGSMQDALDQYRKEAVSKVANPKKIGEEIRSYDEAIKSYNAAKEALTPFEDLVKSAEEWAQLPTRVRAHRMLAKDLQALKSGADQSAYESALDALQSRQDALRVFKEANKKLDLPNGEKLNDKSRFAAFQEAYKEKLIADELARDSTKPIKDIEREIQAKLDNDSIKEFLKKAGIEDLSKQKRWLGGKFKTGNVWDRYRPVELSALRPAYRTALSNINRSALGDAVLDPRIKSLQRAQELAESDSALAKKLAAIKYDRATNPSGLSQGAKDVSLALANLGITVPLATMEDTGMYTPAPYTDMAPADIVRIGLAAMPFVPGRSFARTTLQTPGRKVGGTLPYAALWAKDVANAQEDIDHRNPRKTTYSEALASAMNK